MSGTLSIRARLALAFALLLGLLLAVAVLSLERFEGLTGTTQGLVDHEVKRGFLAQGVNRHAQSAAICLLNLLQTPERDKRVPLYQAMDKENAATDAALDAIRRTMISAETAAEVDNIAELRREYGERFQETVELIELEGVGIARTHFEKHTQLALNRLLDGTQAFAGRQQDKAQHELDGLRAIVADSRTQVVLLAMAALAGGALLAWLIARSITRPVSCAVDVAEVIAGGDYHREVPGAKADEIGALLRALATMRDSIASREAHITRLAYVDTLTGLPNRTRFLERFHALPGDTHGALMILDLDRFAPINDALGHGVGDRLLCEVGQRLRAAIGPEDTAARLWGDEFALLLVGVDRAGALAAVQRIGDALREPITIDGTRLDVDASIGISLFPHDGTDIGDLLRHADHAVADAKRRHEDHAFGSALDEPPSHEQLSLIGEMRDALANDEFEVHYQPKLDLADRRVGGAEALVRWRHPEKGLIPPGRFIPFAEQTGFIREITPWLLRRVIADAAGWRRDGLEAVASVNLSTFDLLNRQLVGQVRDRLAECGLPPAGLCLEITESALIVEPELALCHLRELATLGVKLSIDDYGSGQASLGYVKNLPVNELKIDREFVTAVDSTPKNAAIVRSTVLLCRELGLKVVAEGAETDAEIAWLAAARCDTVQGFGIARPMPLADFLDWNRNFAARV